MGYLKRHLRAVAFAIIVMVLAVPACYAALSTFTINTITGLPATMADFNTVINAINNQIANFITFQNASNPNELQITNASAFAQNATVATAMSSVGPVGSHTTVQKWLVVIDSSGNVLYAPLF